MVHHNMRSIETEIFINLRAKRTLNTILSVHLSQIILVLSKHKIM